jgi:hypothetical protein
LPGSIDEYEARGRIDRQVARGRVMEDPDDARAAVAAASRQLRFLVRAPLLIVGFVLMIGVNAALLSADGLPVAVVALVASAVASVVIGLPVVLRARRRVERSMSANAEVVRLAERRSPSP